jgi:hypothetical protein
MNSSLNNLLAAANQIILGAFQACLETHIMTKWLRMTPVLWLLSGCAAIPALPALSGLVPPLGSTPLLTTTTVNLSRQNYKIVKANAIGSSAGFSFLGLFTFISPRYDEAMTRLYRNAAVTEGKPQAIVNVVYENSSSYFILFALPKITVRADVIEFTDNTDGMPPH